MEDREGQNKVNHYFSLTEANLTTTPGNVSRMDSEGKIKYVSNTSRHAMHDTIDAGF